MAVSVTELRERARLLEAELARQATLSDSLDTRAGVSIGFAGALTGLLVQVKHPSSTLHDAVTVAFVAAIIGVLAAAPLRLKSPDPKVIASYYDSLPEEEATKFACNARLDAIQDNSGITDLKRVLLSLTVLALVIAIVLAARAVM